MRHNILRDTEAKLFSDICKDVKTEPPLIRVQRDDIQGTVANNARPDVSAIGLWSPCQKSMFDIRVVYPNADSYMDKDLSEIYKMNEDEKKRLYNDRILNCERTTFSPLVFTTPGGMGKECERVNKRVAELLAKKRLERYSDTIKYVRNRLRFALLKATVIAVRGTRGKAIESEKDIEEISFNLIPE